MRFNPGLLRVFKLCLITILITHWFGCGWWLVSDLEMADGKLNVPYSTSDNTWHPPLWLKYSGDLSLKYWHAFYWGAGIALSMVPRDIEPVTTTEAVVTTVMMFCGLLLAAFVISSFTSAFASMDSKNALAGKQLDVIRNYLLLKGVPTDLRSRILEYYEYLFTSSQSMEDLRLLKHMPPNLSTQLALSINAKLLAKCPVFREVSNASLAALVSTLTPLVFVPGQILCTEGQRLRTIYFINRGKVQLLRGAGSEAEVLVRTLSDSDNVGLDDFANSPERQVRHSARALTYCDVMSLSATGLTAALEYDAQERVRREAERKENDKAERKEHLSACLRKAGNIAKMSAMCKKLTGSSASTESAESSKRATPRHDPDLGAAAYTASAAPSMADAPTSAWAGTGGGSCSTVGSSEHREDNGAVNVERSDGIGATGGQAGSLPQMSVEETEGE